MKGGEGRDRVGIVDAYSGENRRCGELGKGIDGAAQREGYARENVKRNF